MQGCVTHPHPASHLPPERTCPSLPVYANRQPGGVWVSEGACGRHHLRHISATSPSYLRRISATPPPHLCHTSATPRPHLGHTPAISPPYRRHITAISAPYRRHITAISPPHRHIFPIPPHRHILSFVFFHYFLCIGGSGWKEKGPYYDGLWTGLWSCFRKAHRRCLVGGGAAAMALRAACSGISKR